MSNCASLKASYERAVSLRDDLRAEYESCEGHNCSHLFFLWRSALSKSAQALSLYRRCLANNAVNEKLRNNKDVGFDELKKMEKIPREKDIRCPYCCENVVANAIKCKHCHSSLESSMTEQSGCGCNSDLAADTEIGLPQSLVGASSSMAARWDDLPDWFKEFLDWTNQAGNPGFPLGSGGSRSPGQGR